MSSNKPPLLSQLVDAAPGTANAPLQTPAAPRWLARATNRFILDLDGTLIRAQTLTAGAADLLQQVRDRYVIVSNNSTDTAIGLARKLNWIGLKVNPQQLILAGEETVRLVAERYTNARVQLLASPMLRHFARQLGCQLVDRDADLVVLARDKAFNYRRLASAANAVHRGAKLIVSNPDLNHPAPNDALVPETGALMLAVTACAGVAAQSIIGKPESALFLEGLARLKAEAGDTIVIGDNPATDALGAVRLGMCYLLVGTSELADAESPENLLRFDCEPRCTAPGPAQHRKNALRYS